jgi:DNA-damage-inducible protein J
VKLDKIAQFRVFDRLGYNVAQEPVMPANAVVRARIDARVKEEATAIYAAAGLTLSDAFRMMLMRTVAERALPFEPLMPNAETVAAMKAARRGELVKVGSVKNLMDDLHADD